MTICHRRSQNDAQNDVLVVVLKLQLAFHRALIAKENSGNNDSTKRRVLLQLAETRTEIFQVFDQKRGVVFHKEDLKK